MKNKLTCELLLQYLSDYIDNALYEELTTEAQAHLASCNNCRVVLDTTQQTLFLFRNQGARKIPLERRQRLFAQLQEVFLRDKKTEY